jgi:hypothetical protein
VRWAKERPCPRTEKGLAVEKQIVGSDVVENLYASAPDDQLHIQRYLSANCFGDHYTRTGIDVPTRELLTQLPADARSQERSGPGDPARMAARIIESVDAEPAPLRVVLGSQALESTLTTLRKRIATSQRRLSSPLPRTSRPGSDQHVNVKTSVKEKL